METNKVYDVTDGNRTFQATLFENSRGVLEWSTPERNYAFVELTVVHEGQKKVEPVPEPKKTPTKPLFTKEDEDE